MTRPTDDAAPASGTQDIVVDEVFPHAPATIWNALTSAALISRWLMPPTDFEPVEGKHFTFRTTPAGAWDGTIHCEVLEVVRNERFAFAWTGGDETNCGYGSRLDTIVTFTLTSVDNGTRLRLVHSGFVPSRNDTAFKNLGEGWRLCFGRLDAAITEPS